MLQQKTFVLLFAAGVLGVASSAQSAASSEAAVPASPRVFGPVELIEVLRADAKPLSPGIYKLSREWVGTLTPMKDGLADVRLEPDRPQNIRFNFLVVGKNGMSLESLRTTGKGAYSGGLGFRFTRTPHGAADILAERRLHTLKSWYGNQHGVTDGYGSPEEMNLSEHWRFFSVNPDGRIVCQGIFAQVSEKRKIEENPKAKGAAKYKILSREPAKVNVMNLSQGVFRPADPDSVEEKKRYPSEDDLYAARLAAENARFDAQPEPLRSFLKARHTPDDYDLIAYRAAIDRFRAKPDPLLIRQLVVRLDDGTCEAQMLLEAFMDESHFLKPAAWKPENKRVAVEALIAALPDVPERGMNEDTVVVMILSETGLVALKMDTSDFAIDDSAQPHRPNTMGYGGSYGGLRLKNGYDRKAALRRIAGELSRRWKAKGFPVGRYSSPEPAE